MPTPNKDYREDPKRAVYISGTIDQSLVDRLSPTINQLRLESTDPITAYVDSPGGSIMLADTIRYHLQAPNPEGKRCKLITVVTSRASSAAADFVALGDYSIAYPYADLVYHGSRTPPDSSLTTESATRVARNLQLANEEAATTLARRNFPRFVFRLSQIKSEFAQYLIQPSLMPLAKALQGRLSASTAFLVAEAMKKQATITDLGKSVQHHISRFKDGGLNLSPARWESEMFKAILKYKMNSHKNDRWLLSEGGLQEATEDFGLLHDFYFGAQRQELKKWNRTYGEMVLSDQEKTDFGNFAGNIAERDQWLTDKSAPKLLPIWYLMVSICRLLQGDDYYLPARQAYWLGLIDEVPGSDLPCLRTAAESDQA
jgi:ATP-dependent protease ClpP protease subunit